MIEKVGRKVLYSKNLISLLSSFKGVRPFGRKSVLLITAGQSTLKRHLTIPKAEALKIKGVRIFVIAVGSAFMSGIAEMVKVASRPLQNHLFRVSNFGSLVDRVKLLVKQVAPGKYKIINAQPNKPCSYYG